MTKKKTHAASVPEAMGAEQEVTLDVREDDVPLFEFDEDDLGVTEETIPPELLGAGLPRYVFSSDEEALRQLAMAEARQDLPPETFDEEDEPLPEEDLLPESLSEEEEALWGEADGADSPVAVLLQDAPDDSEEPENTATPQSEEVLDASLVEEDLPEMTVISDEEEELPEYYPTGRARASRILGILACAGASISSFLPLVTFMVVQFDSTPAVCGILLGVSLGIIVAFAALAATAVPLALTSYDRGGMYRMSTAARIGLLTASTAAVLLVIVLAVVLFLGFLNLLLPQIVR